MVIESIQVTTMNSITIAFSDDSMWSIELKAYSPTTLQRATHRARLQWQKNFDSPPAIRFQNRIARIQNMKDEAMHGIDLSEVDCHAQERIAEHKIQQAWHEYNREIGNFLRLYMKGPYTGLWFHPYPGKKVAPHIGWIDSNLETVWLQCRTMAEHDLSDARWITRV